MKWSSTTPAQGDDQSWVARALCVSTEPDVLFMQDASQRQVRMRCCECEVRLECLANALEPEANYGVWGGLTERERRTILRHYPHADNRLEWLRTSDEALACELHSPHVPRVPSFVCPQLAGG